MATPDPIATPSTILSVTLADNLKHPLLRDAILAHNAMLSHNLIALYPEDLSAQVVHADLEKHVNQLGSLGSAHAGVATAVDVRQDVVARGKAIYARVAGIIDQSYPPGTPGRAAFHPTDNTDPTLGDLLIAAGKGILHKGRPPLPEGWTGQSLVTLGEAVNKALAVRDASGKVRHGQSLAAAALIKRTREIRRRLRGLVVQWYGESNPKLVEFGIAPRGPRVGGRRKKAAGVDSAPIG